MDPDPPSTIALTVGVPAWRRHLADPERICRDALAAALARVAGSHWPAQAQVSVLLADDVTVRRLNRDYRGKDRPTNILSFPMFEEQAEAKPFPHHVSHLLIHGCLHLLGYDHQSATDAAVMEGLEREVLAQLGIPDPYAGDATRPVADAAGGLSPEKQ
jgi:probable rRNA maturation factor